MQFALVSIDRPHQFTQQARDSGELGSVALGGAEEGNTGTVGKPGSGQVQQVRPGIERVSCQNLLEFAHGFDVEDTVEANDALAGVLLHVDSERHERLNEQKKCQPKRWRGNPGARAALC